MSYFDFDALAKSAQSTLNSAQSTFESTVQSLEKTSVGTNLQNIFALDNLQQGDSEGAATATDSSSSASYSFKPEEQRETVKVRQKDALLASLDESANEAGAIAELNVKLSSLRSVLAGNEKELSTRAIELSSKAAELSTKDAELASKCKDLVAKDYECATMQKRLASLQDTLSSEQSANTELRKEIKKLSSEGQALRESVEDEAKKSNRNLMDMQEQLNSAQTEIESLQITLASTRADLAAAEKKSEEKSSASPSPNAGGKGKGKGSAAQENNEIKKLRSDLSSSESKRASLEKSLREKEDLYTALDRKGKKQDDESQSKITELMNRISALTRDVAERDTEISAAKEEMSAGKERAKGDLAKLTADLAEKNIIIEKALISQRNMGNAAKDDLAKLTADLTDKNRALEKALASQKTKSEADNATIRSELQESRTNVASKDATIEDLKTKLKDLMKKYADVKAKSQTLEQAEGKATDSQKTVQAELLSLRLKLENSERVAGDQKAMASELTERFAEKEREVSRARATIDSNELQIVELHRELQQAVSATSGLAAEATATQEKLDDALQTVAKLTQQLATVQAENEAKFSSAAKAHSLKVAELQVENESLLLRLKSEDETAKALEEYKKRAQVALKKANSTSSSMASEITEKQKLLDDAQARLAEAESSIEITRQEVIAKLDEIDSYKVKLLKLQHSFDNTVKEKEELSLALTAAHEDSKELIAQLAAAEAEVALAATTAGRERTSVSPDTKIRSISRGENGNSHFPAPSMESSALPDEDEERSKFAAENVVSTISSEQARGGGSSPIPSWAVAAASAFMSLPTTAPSLPPVPTVGVTAEVLAGSEEDSVQLDAGLTLPVKVANSDQLFYVNKLQSQIEDLKRNLAMRGIEIDAAHQELQTEREAKKKLSIRVEELLGYLDRAKNTQESDSVINMEYLKTCVYRFMASTELSERKRLFPVISTIMKLTSQEKATIEAALQSAETVEPFNAILSNFFG